MKKLLTFYGNSPRSGSHRPSLCRGSKRRHPPGFCQLLNELHRESLPVSLNFYMLMAAPVVLPVDHNPYKYDPARLINQYNLPGSN